MTAVLLNIGLKSDAEQAKDKADPTGTWTTGIAVLRKTGVSGGRKKWLTARLRFIGAALVIWGKDGMAQEKRKLVEKIYVAISE